MKTDYESPLEHSSSPDGCREDCPACEDERLHEAPKPYPGPFWFDAEDGTICFRDEHQTICRLADIPDYDDPIQAMTAAHLVLCVNAHDQLVGALRDLDMAHNHETLCRAKEQARAALAGIQPKP